MNAKLLLLKEQRIKPWAMDAAGFFSMLALFALPISTSLLSVSLISAILFWLLSGEWRGNLRQWVSNPYTVIWISFFAVFLLGVTYSPGNIQEIGFALSKSSKFLFIPFLIVIFSEKRWRQRALIAFIAAMSLSLILGICKLYASIHHLPFLYLRHASPATVFKSYIDTNLMMAFATFVLAQIAVSTVSRKLRWGAIALACLMTIYVLWLSEGRSGYFVFFALWILFCVQHLSFRKSLAGIGMLVLVITCAGFFSNTFQERLLQIPKEFQQYREGHQFTSIGQRLQYFQNIFEVAKERPWIGFGTGSLKSVYGSYAKQHQLFSTQNPHNEYLNIFFQFGVLGLVALLAAFAASLYFSLKLPAFEAHILQGTCIAMALGCAGNSWIMDFTSGYWFILMLSLTGSALSDQMPMRSSIGSEPEYTHSILSCFDAPVKAASSAYELVCEQRTEPATKSQLERRRVYAKKDMIHDT